MSISCSGQPTNFGMKLIRANLDDFSTFKLEMVCNYLFWNGTVTGDQDISLYGKYATVLQRYTNIGCPLLPLT